MKSAWKTRTFAMTLSAVLLAGGLAVAGPLAGRPNPVPPPATRLVSKARLDSFNTALKAAGLPLAGLAPAAQFTLTAAAPRNNGAVITSVGLAEFQSDANNSFFVLTPQYVNKQWEFAAANMMFPAEANKNYVVDCTVYDHFSKGTAPVELGFSKLCEPSNSGSPTIQNVTSDAGHALYSFRSPVNGQCYVQFTTLSKSVSFYGCEITRMP